jgi:pimeloyl-ACP methyl ester carboxylesterase
MNVPAEPATRVIFAHGNGLTPGVYAPMLRRLESAALEVHAVPTLGHDPRYPVTDGWPCLRDELCGHLLSLPVKRTVLVGHSLGGLLSLMVALQRPDAVQGLIMLDSPPFGGIRAAAVRLLKMSGRMNAVFGVAQQRRQQWASMSEAKQHFAGRGMFSRWDSEVFDAFLKSGLRWRGTELGLSFDPEVERRIYQTTPHDLGRQIWRAPLHLPVAFVAGRQSRIMKSAGMQLSHGLAGSRFHWVDGSHLFPLEFPARTAALLRQLISDFDA